MFIICLTAETLANLGPTAYTSVDNLGAYE